MELHKSIKPDNKYSISINDSYMEYFEKAYKFTRENYDEDYSRIADTRFNELTIESFSLEYQWVVYTSGFNAKIVSKMFPKLREVYAPLIDVLAGTTTNVNSIDIAVNALGICNNKRKVKSVIDMAFECGAKVRTMGWKTYRDAYFGTPEKLQELPFIGPTTCFHLARNIGLLDFVKPDVHLKRLAAHWGFKDPVALCAAIKIKHDMPLGLIDLCLFYAASTFGSKS